MGIRFALLAMACFALSVAAEPKLRNTVTVPLRLPKNFEPTALPAHSIEETLRVGVVLPTFDPGLNATWTTVAQWESNVNLFEPIPPEKILAIDRIVVNAAEPVAAALPRIFSRLFPGSFVLPNHHCPTCDIVFIVKAETGNITDSQNHIEGVTVTISISAVGRNGVTAAAATGRGSGTKKNGMYWSERTQARGMGEPALRQAMEEVFGNLTSDAELKAFIKEKATERARPSDLETTVTFDDVGSYFPNQRLDAGESARLRIRITNKGGGPAFGVRLRLATPAKAVVLPAETEIGDIQRGITKEIDLPFAAGIEVQTEQQRLQIETIEKRGYGARPLVMQFATERLKRPTFEIADIRLDDRVSGAQGDGNSLPSNGETLEAIILLRNSGPGDAVGASVTLASAAQIEIARSTLSIKAIPAHAVAEVRTSLRLPINFNAPEFALAVRAVESRGAAVAIAEKDQRWTVQAKKPQIEIGYRLFDGNSAQSRGNRDGVANNGETLEMALIPINHGSLTARSVRLTLTSMTEGLVVHPSSIDVGDLPPSAEGSGARVRITIPRAVGRGDAWRRLPVNVTIAQADFPLVEQILVLPFAALRPDLAITLASQSSVVEGRPTAFTVDLRNNGLLAAEDVKVEIRCDDPAIELLDPAGTPARTVSVNVGSIGPGTSTGKIQLKAQVRRNVAPATALLKVTVPQRDFDAAVTQRSFTILKEDAAVISAVPPPAPEAPVARGMAVPAAVSFQRYRDGNRLADEQVGLTFEVQSQTPLQIVRLEQNRRAIDLPRSSELQTTSGYLWQYEPDVTLEYGANEFEVIAVTTEGARSSRKMTLYREAPRGKIWVAVVGVSSYRDAMIMDLDFAREDAVAVNAYYRQLGIPDEQVIQLLNEEATLANIKRNLGTELVRRASNPDDTVILYFAGHGEMEADRSSSDSDGYSKYLLPHDANPADLFGSALSMEELSRILQRLRSERVVLIIDSCFSGAAGGRTPFEPNAASRGVISEEFLSRMASAGKGRIILTASGSREVAQESTERRHGIFTYFLLEGLRGAADADRDGRVDVDEIYKFVSQKVAAATRGRQNPMRKSPNLTGTVILGGRLQ